MHTHVIATLILLVACAPAAASDLYTAINRIRGGAGPCASAAKLPPLAAKPELGRAAAGIARGGELAASIKASGYRAAASNAIRISGGSESEQLELLQKKHCADLLDPDASDIGVHRNPGQTVIVLATPFNPRVAGTPEAAARRILKLTNDARAVPRNCGSKRFEAAGPLRWNSTLAEVAGSHAESMARHDFFDHSGRDGSTPDQRVARVGYRYRATGENIAAGQDRPEDAVVTWIKSPAHCANLMNSSYTEMGAGFSINKASKRGIYWVQVFGTPR